MLDSPSDKSLPTQKELSTSGNEPGNESGDDYELCLLDITGEQDNQSRGQKPPQKSEKPDNKSEDKAEKSSEKSEDKSDEKRSSKVPEKPAEKSSGKPEDKSDEQPSLKIHEKSSRKSIASEKTSNSTIYILVPGAKPGQFILQPQDSLSSPFSSHLRITKPREKDPLRLLVVPEKETPFGTQKPSRRLSIPLDKDEPDLLLFAPLSKKQANKGPQDKLPFALRPMSEKYPELFESTTRPNLSTLNLNSLISLALGTAPGVSADTESLRLGLRRPGQKSGNTNNPSLEAIEELQRRALAPNSNGDAVVNAVAQSITQMLNAGRELSFSAQMSVSVLMIGAERGNRAAIDCLARLTGLAESSNDNEQPERSLVLLPQEPRPRVSVSASARECLINIARNNPEQSPVIYEALLKAYLNGGDHSPGLMLRGALTELYNLPGQNDRFLASLRERTLNGNSEAARMFTILVAHGFGGRHFIQGFINNINAPGPVEPGTGNPQRQAYSPNWQDITQRLRDRGLSEDIMLCRINIAANPNMAPVETRQNAIEELSQIAFFNNGENRTAVLDHIAKASKNSNTVWGSTELLNLILKIGAYPEARANDNQSQLLDRCIARSIRGDSVAQQAVSMVLAGLSPALADRAGAALVTRLPNQNAIRGMLNTMVHTTQLMGDHHRLAEYAGRLAARLPEIPTNVEEMLRNNLRNNYGEQASLSAARGLLVLRPSQTWSDHFIQNIPSNTAMSSALLEMFDQRRTQEIQSRTPVNTGDNNAGTSPLSLVHQYMALQRRADEIQAGQYQFNRSLDGNETFSGNRQILIDRITALRNSSHLVYNFDRSNLNNLISLTATFLQRINQGHPESPLLFEGGSLINCDLANYSARSLQLARQLFEQARNPNQTWLTQRQEEQNRLVLTDLNEQFRTLATQLGFSPDTVKTSDILQAVSNTAIDCGIANGRITQATIDETRRSVENNQALMPDIRQAKLAQLERLEQLFRLANCAQNRERFDQEREWLTNLPEKAFMALVEDLARHGRFTELYDLLQSIQTRPEYARWRENTELRDRVTRYKDILHGLIINNFGPVPEVTRQDAVRLEELTRNFQAGLNVEAQLRRAAYLHEAARHDTDPVSRATLLVEAEQILRSLRTNNQLSVDYIHRRQGDLESQFRLVQISTVELLGQPQFRDAINSIPNAQAKQAITGLLNDLSNGALPRHIVQQKMLELVRLLEIHLLDVRIENGPYLRNIVAMKARRLGDITEEDNKWVQFLGARSIAGLELARVLTTRAQFGIGVSEIVQERTRRLEEGARQGTIAGNELLRARIELSLLPAQEKERRLEEVTNIYRQVREEATTFNPAQLQQIVASLETTLNGIQGTDQVAEDHRSTLRADMIAIFELSNLEMRATYGEADTLVRRAQDLRMINGTKASELYCEATPLVMRLETFGHDLYQGDEEPRRRITEMRSLCLSNGRTAGNMTGPNARIEDFLAILNGLRGDDPDLQRKIREATRHIHAADEEASRIIDRDHCGRLITSLNAQIQTLRAQRTVESDQQRAENLDKQIQNLTSMRLAAEANLNLRPYIAFFRGVLALARGDREAAGILFNQVERDAPQLAQGLNINRMKELARGPGVWSQIWNVTREILIGVIATVAGAVTSPFITPVGGIAVGAATAFLVGGLIRGTENSITGNGRFRDGFRASDLATGAICVLTCGTAGLARAGIMSVGRAGLTRAGLLSTERALLREGGALAFVGVGGRGVLASAVRHPWQFVAANWQPLAVGTVANWGAGSAASFVQRIPGAVGQIRAGEDSWQVIRQQSFGAFLDGWMGLAAAPLVRSGNQIVEIGGAATQRVLNRVLPFRTWRPISAFGTGNPQAWGAGLAFHGLPQGISGLVAAAEAGHQAARERISGPLDLTRPEHRYEYMQRLTATGALSLTGRVPEGTVQRDSGTGEVTAVIRADGSRCEFTYGTTNGRRLLTEIQFKGADGNITETYTLIPERSTNGFNSYRHRRAGDTGEGTIVQLRDNRVLANGDYCYTKADGTQVTLRGDGTSQHIYNNGNIVEHDTKNRIHSIARRNNNGQMQASIFTYEGNATEPTTIAPVFGAQGITWTRNTNGRYSPSDNSNEQWLYVPESIGTGEVFERYIGSGEYRYRTVCDNVERRTFSSRAFEGVNEVTRLDRTVIIRDGLVQEVRFPASSPVSRQVFTYDANRQLRSVTSHAPGGLSATVTRASSTTAILNDGYNEYTAVHNAPPSQGQARTEPPFSESIEVSAHGRLTVGLDGIVTWRNQPVHTLSPHGVADSPWVPGTPPPTMYTMPATPDFMRCLQGSRPNPFNSNQSNPFARPRPLTLPTPSAPSWSGQSNDTPLNSDW